MIRIEGVVTTSSGRPVPGVAVTVDRPGVPTVPTDDSGAYRLEINGGAPIGRLSYTHSNFDYAVVESISGALSQSISKVLYQRREKRVAAAMVDTLGAYEQLLVALLQSRQEERQTMIAAYRKARWVEAVRELPVDGAGAVEWLAPRRDSLNIAFAKAMG